MTLRIDDPRRVAIDSGLTELSARVEGERLWFRIPADRDVALRGEPFISCLVVPAMARGEALELPDSLPVCPVFLDGVRQYMDVVRWWGPLLGTDLVPVPIRATESSSPPCNDRVAFFSGGVDGLYTMLEAQDRLDAVVFSHGVDFQLDSELAHDAIERNRAWLASHDMPLWTMSSNARFIGHHFGIGWNVHNGACLAGFGHALGVERILIAAGHAWLDCIGAGSHLLSDPLLSSAATTVEHHGFGPMRWEKLARIADEPGVLGLLRVCWQDRGYNCGRCEKCRRTMLLLHLLGLESTSFPPARKFEDVEPGSISDPDGAAYVEQALVLAHRLGNDRAARRLEVLLRRWRVRRWAASADHAFLGGLLHRLRR